MGGRNLAKVGERTQAKPSQDVLSERSEVKLSKLQHAEGEKPSLGQSRAGQRRRAISRYEN